MSDGVKLAPIRRLSSRLEDLRVVVQDALDRTGFLVTDVSHDVAATSFDDYTRTMVAPSGLEFESHVHVDRVTITLERRSGTPWEIRVRPAGKDHE